MGAISTGIHLQDDFSGVMMGIINAVNLAVSSMTDMSQVMNTGINTSSLEGARDCLNQATIAARELSEALGHQEEVSLPSPPAWENQSNMQIFNDTGIQRLTNEMNALGEVSDGVLRSQQRIDSQALDMDILPPNASWDINATSHRIEELSRQLGNLQSQNITLIGDSNAEQISGQFERIREEMNDIVNLQARLDQAIEAGDVSGMNEGYNQLNHLIGQAERRARSMQQVMDSVANIRWQSDTMPVFDGSGMERFRQEVQSTDAMLASLNARQEQLQQTAAGMNLLPPAAVQDIGAVGARIQALADRIQQIENNPLNMGTDRANSELEQLRAQLGQALSAQESLNSAVDSMDIEAANQAYLRLSQTISNTERYIRDNADAQGNLNREVQGLHAPIANASTGFRGWQKAIIVANQAVNLIKNTMGRLGVMDMGGAFERMDTMSRFQKTVSIMTGDANMANAALEKLKDTTVGTAYGLDVASKATQGFLTRGMGLEKATEQVRIWADAVSFYGNGTNEQLENVVDAVGKIYTKGTVEATQMDRLFDAGIGAAELYAKAVGKSVGEVKDALSNREISSADFLNTVTQALDSGVSSGAAKDAGNTWATTFANVQAAVSRGWVSVVQNLDTALAANGLPSSMELVTMFGQKVESVLNQVGDSMWWVVNMGVNIGRAMGTAGDFVADHWGIIAPIIGAIAATWLTYKGVLIGFNIVRAITNTLEAIHTARAALHTGATIAGAAATTTATGAQVGFNAALLACPATWIMLAIIALIAVLIALANHFSGTGHVALTTFGAICGGINVVIGFFKNLGISFANVSLGIVAAASALGENIMTAFHNAICSVRSWFFGLLSDAETVIAGICEALNKLPFVEFDYSWVTSAADDYAARAAAAANDKRDYVSVGDAFLDAAQTYDAFGENWVDDSYREGAKWGDGMIDKLTKALKGVKPDMPDAGAAPDAIANAGNEASEIARNTGDTAKSAQKAVQALDITGENLKYIKDMAEREYVNRFTTAKISVKQTNHNTVKKGMDLDGINDYLLSDVTQRMAATAEGVH